MLQIFFLSSILTYFSHFSFSRKATSTTKGEIGKPKKSKRPSSFDDSGMLLVQNILYLLFHCCVVLLYDYMKARGGAKYASALHCTILV